MIQTHQTSGLTPTQMQSDARMPVVWDTLRIVIRCDVCADRESVHFTAINEFGLLNAEIIVNQRSEGHILRQLRILGEMLAGFTAKPQWATWMQIGLCGFADMINEQCAQLLNQLRIQNPTAHPHAHAPVRSPGVDANASVQQTAINQRSPQESVIYANCTNDLAPALPNAPSSVDLRGCTALTTHPLYSLYRSVVDYIITHGNYPELSTRNTKGAAKLKNYINNATRQACAPAVVNQLAVLIDQNAGAIIQERDSKMKTMYGS